MIVYKSDGLGALDEDAATDLVADFTGEVGKAERDSI